MGLIKAIAGSVGGVMADQWKEFFYCEAMEKNVLVTKGQKRTSSRSSNKKGSDNIISNGSGIAVADGQCMIIVEQGKIVEVCAEPGEFTYDASTEPSIFSGNLKDSVMQTFKSIGKRFTYGGDTGKDQRVYYFNTKELIDNKFGTPNPIPFRLVDSKRNIDLDAHVRCSGVYSYRIADPLIFYSRVCGNVSEEYRREELDPQLKAEFLAALQPALGALSDLELRPSQIPSHNLDLQCALNKVLSESWGQLRGLEVVNVAISSVTVPEEDERDIREAQREYITSDPTMAAGGLARAQIEAMKEAAKNPGGAMTGFMGLNMAAASGGLNAQNLFAMSQQQQQQQQMYQQQQQPAPQSANAWKCACGTMVEGNFCPNCGAKKPAPQNADTWKCACGAMVSGKFCPECGSPRPQDNGSWKCSCGTVNTGKFCSNCGSKKPEAVKSFRCNKCGWQPDDPTNPPKFCPECGDIFDQNDIV